MLYRNPPSEMPGRLKRRTSKRDILEDMHDVMQLFAVHAANRLYVCKNLNNIPPVSMKNIDPVMIYRQTVDCRSEVESLKKAHEQQLATLMDIILQLREDIGKLVSSHATPPPSAPSTVVTPPNSEPLVTKVPSAPAAAVTPTPFRDRLLAGANNTDSPTTPTPATHAPPPPPPPPPNNGAGAFGGARAKSTAMGLSMGRVHGSSTTSYFAPSTAPFGQTRGKGWVVDQDGFYSREKRDRQHQPQQLSRDQQQRPRSTIGTGTRQRLRVVPVVRHDIFVSRVHPDTTEADIKVCVRDAIGDAAATVTKLRTRHDTYASFRVSCQQRDHYDALLDPHAWDAGTLVREYVPSAERPQPRLSVLSDSR